MENVFHQGELEVQRLAGDEATAEKIGKRAIKKEIVSGAIPFIEQQKMVIVSSRDAEENLWASLLIGAEGFIQVANGNEVKLNRKMIRSTVSDIFYQNIQMNREIGILFIEHATRRRFRVNGKAILTNDELQINVLEAYGNCPKYLKRSIFSIPENIGSLSPIISEGKELGQSEKEWIRKADTFYLATQSLEGKADASHRGGNSGFIEILADGTLKIPDYPGNFMYNSLGNIHVNPNAGLTFVNFEKGEVLQLSGKGKIHFNQTSENDLQKTGGTGRFWLFKTEQWIRTNNHHEVEWSHVDYSPFNP